MLCHFVKSQPFAFQELPTYPVWQLSCRRWDHWQSLTYAILTPVIWILDKTSIQHIVSLDSYLTHWAVKSKIWVWMHCSQRILGNLGPWGHVLKWGWNMSNKVDVRLHAQFHANWKGPQFSWNGPGAVPTLGIPPKSSGNGDGNGDSLVLSGTEFQGFTRDSFVYICAPHSESHPNTVEHRDPKKQWIAIRHGGCWWSKQGLEVVGMELLQQP